MTDKGLRLALSFTSVSLRVERPKRDSSPLPLEAEAIEQVVLSLPILLDLDVEIEKYPRPEQPFKVWPGLGSHVAYDASSLSDDHALLGLTFDIRGCIHSYNPILEHLKVVDHNCKGVRKLLAQTRQVLFSYQLRCEQLVRLVRRCIRGKEERSRLT